MVDAGTGHARTRHAGTGHAENPRIAPATASIRLARATNKHVIGCMKEQITMAKAYLSMVL
jgi:hypothetical protein